MLKAVIILIIGAGIGALMGYYGKCNDGQCPLTANPWRGAMWGLFLAGIVAYPLLMNTFRKKVPDSGNIIYPASSADFKTLISAEGKTALIDFYADWCAPCHSLAPVINKLADEYKGKIDVIKINVDKFPDLAREYNANSIPLIIITKNGKEYKRLVGVESFDTYVDILGE